MNTPKWELLTFFLFFGGGGGGGGAVGGGGGEDGSYSEHLLHMSVEKNHTMLDSRDG